MKVDIGRPEDPYEHVLKMLEAIRERPSTERKEPRFESETLLATEPYPGRRGADEGRSLPTQAFIMVRAESRYDVDALAYELAQEQHVISAAVVVGCTDIIMEIGSLEDPLYLQSLYKRVRATEGVSQTETLPVCYRASDARARGKTE
jgi:hypothetical protein